MLNLDELDSRPSLESVRADDIAFGCRYSLSEKPRGNPHPYSVVAWGPIISSSVADLQLTFIPAKQMPLYFPKD